MRSCTEHVQLMSPPESVWQFVADPQSLPLWAAGFCRSIRQVNGRWIAETAGGPVEVEFLADPVWGTVDFLIQVPDGSESRAFSRVAGEGAHAVYSFTFFAQPGESEAGFTARCEALREELRILAARFRARSACDAA